MADLPEVTLKSRPRKKIRWWPAFLILLLAVVAIYWVRTSYGRHRQDQNIAIANIVIIAFALLIVWCVLLSRFKWKLRWGLVGSALATIGVVAALFRIHGVTGDLVPILELRWKRQTLTAIETTHNKTLSNSPRNSIQLTNDYPQFLGPNRNGSLERPRLVQDWNSHPPSRLWVRPVGQGWSGFAVVGNRALTQEQRGENEAVVCYDLVSGSPLWSYAYAAHFQSSLAGEGPRATPCIASGRVYTQGATGLLNCLELETGKLIWSKDILRDNRASMNEWGISSSPLVIDDLVVVNPGAFNGRSLVAYRAGTGEFAWGGGNEGCGYSSPSLATLAEVPQIIIFNDGGVFAHSVSDGKVLWNYHWPGGHPHVSNPVVLPGGPGSDLQWIRYRQRVGTNYKGFHKQIQHNADLENEPAQGQVHQSHLSGRVYLRA
jgi:outer membrane protein assembly factor BamB